MSMPSEGDDGGRNVFDRMADVVARLTAKAWFFTFCVMLVVVWAPSIFIIKTVDTWQLIINTITTIVTFLLVGLMQNTAARESAATQQKLNALAAGQLLLLRGRGLGDTEEAKELRTAIGLEEEESA